MKQREDIKRELTRLRGESDPGDYYAVIQEIVVNHLSHEPNLRDLLHALEIRYPREFKDALSGNTIHQRTRDKAFRLASFLCAKQATGIGKANWGAKQNPRVGARTLRDDQELYEKDQNFQGQVDEYLEMLRQIGK